MSGHTRCGSGTGLGSLEEVWDGSGEPRGGPGRLLGPWDRSVMGRWTVEEVRDGSLDPVPRVQRTVPDLPDGQLTYSGPLPGSKQPF